MVEKMTAPKALVEQVREAMLISIGQGNHESTTTDKERRNAKEFMFKALDQLSAFIQEQEKSVRVKVLQTLLDEKAGQWFLISHHSSCTACIEFRCDTCSRCIIQQKIEEAKADLDSQPEAKDERRTDS